MRVVGKDLYQSLYRSDGFALLLLALHFLPLAGQKTLFLADLLSQGQQFLAFLLHLHILSLDLKQTSCQLSDRVDVDIQALDFCLVLICHKIQHLKFVTGLLDLLLDRVQVGYLLIGVVELRSS